MLTRGEYVAGVASDFGYKVLRVERAASATDGLVEKAFLAHLHFAAPVLPGRLTVGAELPLGLHEVRSLTVAGTASDNMFVLGDAQLNAKVRLLNTSEDKFSLVAIPFLFVPFGYGDRFAGSSTVSGGFRLSAELKLHERASFNFNPGALFQRTFHVGNQSNGHQILIGMGTDFRLVSNVHFVNEINIRSELSEPFEAGIQTPTEWLFGLKQNFDELNTSIYALGGRGFSNENGAPVWRVVTGWNIRF